MMPRKQGFTLIELLLTLGVLAVGLTSILALLPRVTEFSRELRDEDRMQTFADAVFESVAWSTTVPDESSVLSEEEQHRLPHILNDQPFVISEAEQTWPDTGGVDDLVPLYYYKIAVQTNSVYEIAVVVRVRPFSQQAYKTFEKILYPQVEAW